MGLFGPSKAELAAQQRVQAALDARKAEAARVQARAERATAEQARRANPPRPKDKLTNRKR